MLLKGEALIDSFTLGFAISGKRNEWKVTVSGPGNIAVEAETRAAEPYQLFDEMLLSVYAAAVRYRFPGRKADAAIWQ
jgi:hypothetical protein